MLSDLYYIVKISMSAFHELGNMILIIHKEYDFRNRKTMYYKDIFDLGPPS